MKAPNIRILTLGTVGLAVLAAVSCGWLGNQPVSETGRAFVVLVDRSASTDQDRTLYQRAADQVMEKLSPGDRLIASPITQASANDFRTYLDESLPKPFPPMKLWDVPEKYRGDKQAWDEQYKKEMDQIHQGLARVLGSPSASQETKIFESLRVVAQVFASDHRPVKVLILLSDMLEDSDEANFETQQVSDAAIEKEIARQQRQRTLPDLHGVHVFVAGASGQPLGRAAALERFWRRYFEQAGAPLDLGAYSRAVPNFNL